MLQRKIPFDTLAGFLLTALFWAAPSAPAAELVPNAPSVGVGDSVLVRIEQASNPAAADWRSSVELQIAGSEPGLALFRAVKPGMALVTATVDGQLASTFIQVAAAEQTAEATPPPLAVPPREPAVAVPLAQPESAAVPAQPRTVQPAAPGLISQQPRLREILPQNAFAYLRIPNPWGLLGAPKGNVYSQAVGSRPYAEAVAGMRSGFVENLLPEAPPPIQSVLRLLMDQIRSPLEIAVMAPANPQSPMPDLLISAALAADDLQTANEILSAIAQPESGIELNIPLGPDGSGMLLAQGLPLQSYFAVAEKRLYLSLGNLGPTPQPLNQWVAAQQPVADHPMYAAEQDIDAGGQGLFLWAAPGPLTQTLEQMGMAEEVAMVRAFGGGEAKAVAAGFGSSNGKQRLKLLLDMPLVGFRTFLPMIDANPTLQTAGEPQLALMLGLPDPADLANFENNLLGMADPEQIQAYQEGKQVFQSELGFSVEQLLAAFGDELMLIQDQAGYYLALRLRDPALYEQILARLLERFAPPYETRQLLGHTYHHLALPGMEPAVEEADPLSRRLAQLPSHLYWTLEGDYLLLSNLPQTLMDYHLITHRVSLADWLRDTQGMNPNGALVLGTTRSRGTPRLMYGVNLWILSTLGDLTGRPVDLFSLPTPRELNLPDSGALGIQIASSREQLAVELVFESSPVELLMAGGGITSLTTAGILAAIAIPAYADYTTRAEIAGELAQVQQVKQEVLAFYITQGRFPNAEEADNLLAQMPLSDSMYLSLEPDKGIIGAEIYGAGLDGENRLILTPQIDAGGALLWRCEGSTLDTKHMQHLELCD